MPRHSLSSINKIIKHYIDMELISGLHHVYYSLLHRINHLRVQFSSIHVGTNNFDFIAPVHRSHPTNKTPPACNRCTSFHQIGVIVAWIELMKCKNSEIIQFVIFHHPTHTHTLDGALIYISYFTCTRVV